MPATQVWVLEGAVRKDLGAEWVLLVEETTADALRQVKQRSVLEELTEGQQSCKVSNGEGAWK